MKNVVTILLKRTFQVILTAAVTVAFSTASAQGRPDTGMAKGDQSLELHTGAEQANIQSLTQLTAEQLLAYDQGWRDGCATGLYLRALRFNFAPLAGDPVAQNPERFRTNNDYALGWGDGISICDAGPSDRP